MGAANAQIQDLGVRGAFGSGAGAELSAMWGLGGNRLETDLGWAGWDNANYINLTAIYQWTWQLGGDFGWFAGVGGNVGLWNGTPITTALASVWLVRLVSSSTPRQFPSSSLSTSVPSGTSSAITVASAMPVPLVSATASKD